MVRSPYPITVNQFSEIPESFFTVDNNLRVLNNPQIAKKLIPIPYITWNIHI